ncbi:hypothetical protein KA005_44030, partial [bacterium]|nr:hypothetical protein [bacterium]
YEVEIPGCWEERRVWFPEVTRTYSEIVPEHEEEYQEWISTHYETEEYTVAAIRIPRKIVVPGEVMIVEKEVCEWEEQVITEPVFEKVFDEDFEKYELIAEDRAVMRIAGRETDSIIIRNIETGIQYEWTCEFIGYATKTGENTYVVPE